MGKWSVIIGLQNLSVNFLWTITFNNTIDYRNDVIKIDKAQSFRLQKSFDLHSKVKKRQLQPNRIMSKD